MVDTRYSSASNKRTNYGKRKRKKRRSRLIWSILVILVILVLVGTAWEVQKKESPEKFYENIVIDTVNVGNMSQKQAEAAVRACIQEQVQADWTFQCRGDIFQIEAQQLIKIPDYMETVVSDAWNDMQKRSLWDQWFHKEETKIKEYAIPIEYDTEAMDQLVIQWKEKWNQEPVNASLSLQGSSFVVVPDQDGYVIDEEEVFSWFPVYYEDIQDLTIDIPVQTQKADVSTDSWANVGLLSSYSTQYNPGEVDRTHNLTLAVAEVNGTILYPGEVFSFNQVVGMRTAEAGYREAKVISNGAYEPELGGGICQVSSTLYNGVLLAGLQIVERHNHALDVSYVSSGRDATVYYGSQDFRFKNSNQSPIYITMSIGGGTVSASIYGNLSEKKNISISTVLDQTTPYSTEYEEDETVPEGTVIQSGADGKTVSTFRNYLDTAGNIVSQENLGQSVYQPQTKIISGSPPDEESEISKDTEKESALDQATHELESSGNSEETMQQVQEEEEMEETDSSSEESVLQDFDPFEDPFADAMF